MEVILVENLSKLYDLGQVGTGTISNDLNRWWAGVRGKEDPYALIGQTNDRTKKANKYDHVWALKDINFSVNQGEVLGIIGRNGAGKSTLLKIISRITTPTTGSVKVKGRIASLLEVGTGFHPEMTGRENIFMNGTLLGMTRREIQTKLEEIIDFAGVALYVDTPVKRYSSGMQVRLAFAVAAFLEPEILIVDEVLAVGDAEFQKKAIGRMQQVSRGDGRTVLFVSHSMASIKQLCSRCLVMNQGGVAFEGSVDSAITAYVTQNNNTSLTSVFRKEVIQNNPIEIIAAEVHDENRASKNQFNADEDIFVQLTCHKNENLPGILGYLQIRSESDEAYIESDTYDFLPNILDQLELGEHQLLLRIPRRVLPKGQFKVYLNFTSTFSSRGHNLDSPKDILKFEVYDTTTRRGIYRKAYTNTIIEWKKVQISAHVKQ